MCCVRGLDKADSCVGIPCISTNVKLYNYEKKVRLIETYNVNVKISAIPQICFFHHDHDTGTLM